MSVAVIQHLKISLIVAAVLTLGLAANCHAQDSAPAKTTEKPAPVAQQPKAAKPASENAQSEKKMVQDATINLQTTVTGNQEQPRVLYILPWQNPVTGDVDFESLDNEQKAVFGHVEREELRRELEAAGEKQ